MRAREEVVKKIQASTGYDRTNAEKVYEMTQVRMAEGAFGLACGLLAVYKVRPMQRQLQQHTVIFRKPWMRVPILASAFGAAYFVGTALPARVFQKFSRDYNGINADTVASRHDLVGRFRLFEDVEVTSQEEQVRNYLATYSKDALTKPELVD